MNDQPLATTSQPSVDLPHVPHEKITQEILHKVDALLRSFTAVCAGGASASGGNISDAEREIEERFLISAGQQRRYKAELRKLFNLPSRSPLSLLTAHPQIKQALEFVLVRDERSDKNTLRSAKDLVVLRGHTGEYASAEKFLLSIFSRPDTSAIYAHTVLSNQCVAGKVFKEIQNGDQTTLVPCTLQNLPSLPSVQRWLRRKSKEIFAINWAKKTRAERDAFNIYVKRDPTQWRVRGFQEGDHTEIDVQVINSQTMKYDRLWATIWVDRHSSLGCGYFLSYRPNSETIAISARNSFFGTQLKVAIPDEKGGVRYQTLDNFADIPDEIEIDNGKDYRSRYTGQVFGKIDFADDVRMAIQRFSTVHYAEKLHPQSKPYVENRFRWLNEYWKKLPGYKGSHYQKKPESLKAEEKQNLILFDWQFAQLFDLAWQAHNNRPMKRLGGLSRVQYVLQHQQNRRVISDERILDLLMMKIETRQIRRGWVTVHGIPYFSADLQEHHGEDCVVYYDPQNVGYAHIWIKGRFVTVAIKADLIGTTEQEWLDIVKMRKAKDKNLNEQIRSLHGEINAIEAKAFGWNGMIGNVSFVSGDLIDKRSVPVNLLTGMEQEAKRLAEEKRQTEQMLELQKQVKERTKKQPLTLAMVDRIR